MNNMLEIENDEGDIEEWLIRYCKCGNYKQVVYIFDKFTDHPGFNINCRDHERNTPLILSVKQGHGSIVQELLRHMPDITLANKRGQTSIDLATNPIMRFIFGCVSTCLQYSDRMFCNACWLGNIEVVERCLARDKHLVPCDLSNLDDVHCLLLPVANLSLLETAATNIKCSYKPAQVLNCLLNQFTTIPPSCRTLLHIVAKSTAKSSLEVARILLHRSFDVLATDEHGFTALHVAARSGNNPVLELLLTKSKYGLWKLINVESKSGCTPLHLAAMEGREDCVKTLLRLGASKDIVNDSGRTPIQDSKSVRIKNLFLAPESRQKTTVLPESSFVLSRSNTAVPRTPGYTPLHFGKKSAEPFQRSKESIFDSRETFIEPREFYGSNDVDAISVSVEEVILQPQSIKFPLIPRRKCSQSVSLECLKEESVTEPPETTDKVAPMPNRNKSNNGKTFRPPKGSTKTGNKRRLVLPQKPKKEIPKPQKSMLTPSFNKTTSQRSEVKQKETKAKIVCEVPLAIENIEIFSDDEAIYESDFNTDNSSEKEIHVTEDEELEDGEDLNDTLTNSASSGLSSHIRWRKGEQLGKGSYGTVWKGMLEDGQYIAVKEILLPGEVEDELSSEMIVNTPMEIKREIDILQNLRHKNIVKYLGACDSHSCIHILMEFVSGGSIAYILSKFGGFSENIVRRYTRQIVSAVSFLHQNEVVHRDIKAANVMVTPKGVIKIIDFGCAKRMAGFNSVSESARLHSGLQGSVYWMAPEVINGKSHSHKSDVWSIGCTVHEMFTTKPPWHELHPFAAMFAIGSGSKQAPQLRGFVASDGAVVSDCAADFVGLCLTRDRKTRPPSEDLLASGFLR